MQMQRTELDRVEAERLWRQMHEQEREEREMAQANDREAQHLPTAEAAQPFAQMQQQEQKGVAGESSEGDHAPATVDRTEASEGRPTSPSPASELVAVNPAIEVRVRKERPMPPCAYQGVVRGGLKREDLVEPAPAAAEGKGEEDGKVSNEPKGKKLRMGEIEGNGAGEAISLLEHMASLPRRRSRRGNNALTALAEHLIEGRNAVIITGAGLSVGSGVRPFRGSEGLWSLAVWTRATRESFREDPLAWYNDFWLPHFSPSTYSDHFRPNAGHEVIARLASLPFAEVRVITQNIDGLHTSTKQRWNWPELLIEAHGRLGLYRCFPEVDSDTDSDSDHDEDRPVKLGNRRKTANLREAYYKYGDGAAEGKEGKAGVGEGEDKAINDPIILSAPPGPTHSVEGKESGKTHNHVICRYELEECFPASLLAENDEKTRRIMLGGMPSDDDWSDCDEGQNEREGEKGPEFALGSSAGFGSEPGKAEDKAGTKSGGAGVGVARGRPCQSRSKKKRRRSGKSDASTIKLTEAPMCPECLIPCLPQALLFDEGYHAHDYYQFERMEEWIGSCDLIVFVGTSFKVNITDVALEHARERGIPVFNFNMDRKGDGALKSTSRLHAENIFGDVGETLPQLWAACEEEMNLRGMIDDKGNTISM
jgi:NAD-dependent SIR2 family protein deacetylase